MRSEYVETHIDRTERLDVFVVPVLCVIVYYAINRISESVRYIILIIFRRLKIGLITGVAY